MHAPHSPEHRAHVRLRGGGGRHSVYRDGVARGRPAGGVHAKRRARSGGTGDADLQGILAGLAAAHAQAIVHRDLKPDNVFLARDVGGTYVVKLLDFGIAKVMDLAGGMGSRTSTGMLLGTPAYMSPEQIRSARDVDQRADLWSAGVMFYEMLTGRSAFPAPTEYARLAAVLTTEPVPLEQVDRALLPLAAFLARALKKNRDERFASALEMARALMAEAPQAGLREERHRANSGTSSPPLHGLPEVPSAFSFPAPGHPSAAGRIARESLANPVPVSIVDSKSSRGVGSTLASVAPDAVVVEPALRIAVMDSLSLGETLPSKDPPVAKSAGRERRFSTLTLIASALVAGILLGWALSRIL